jgi:hypothetical protein
MKAVFFQRFPQFMLFVLGWISILLMFNKAQAESLLATTLEAVFFLYAASALIWSKSKVPAGSIIIFLCCLIYTLASYFYAVVYRKADLLDFLMIYKSFIYITFLTFLTNKTLISAKILLKIFDAVLIIFFVKYILMIGLGISDRPIVYIENNFELMILYALYLLRYKMTKEKFMIYLGIVGMITILSLSRSCLLMFSVLALFVVWDSFKKSRAIVLPVAFCLLGYIVYYIFAMRSGSLEDIDRFRFFMVFLDEVKEWNFSDFLFGNERVTALSHFSCKTLSYYQRMFSYSGDGSCYSVVLHAFLLRVILDHGFIGFLFIFYSSYYLLIKSGVKKNISLVFLAIVLVNGLSVSSFNNLFYALSMLILMSVNKSIDNRAATMPVKPIIAT